MASAGIDFLPSASVTIRSRCAGVDVGHHRVEEAGHRPFRLREERLGRELLGVFGLPHPLVAEVAVVDLPHPLVEEVASQRQPQRHQRNDGQHANAKPVIAQGRTPWTGVPTACSPVPIINVRLALIQGWPEDRSK